MEIKKLQKKINSIIKKEYGLAAFVVLKTNEDYSLRKFVLDDNLNKKVKEILNQVLLQGLLCNEAELDSSDNIADKRKVYYEIECTTDYKPFDFLNSYNTVSEDYSEKDVDQIMGYAFRLNVNDSAIWIYQQIVYSQLIKKSRNIYAIFSGNKVYTLLQKDILKIENKIDCLIIGNKIITSKIALMQKMFKFEKYIRSEAEKTVECISQMEILKSVDKLKEFCDQGQLTNAKKLMKAKQSPVLRMDNQSLLNKLVSLPRYKDKFKIENNKIIIKSKKQAIDFLKMLNDDILKSELTDTEYDSSVKKELSPIE